jgi:hypothetical protein
MKLARLTILALFLASAANAALAVDQKALRTGAEIGRAAHDQLKSRGPTSPIARPAELTKEETVECYSACVGSGERVTVHDLHFCKSACGVR